METTGVRESLSGFLWPHPSFVLFCPAILVWDWTSNRKEGTFSRFVHKVFMKHLLCARPCSELW